MKLIALRLGGATVYHGYTDTNEEIVSQVTEQPFQERLVSVDRILSITFI